MVKHINDEMYLIRLVSFSLQHDEITMFRELYSIDKQGRYWIANNGKIYSVCRNEIREKAQFDNGNGYLYVSIGNKNYYVHRLMAEYFLVNDKPKEKTVVHHIDGNRQNNDIKNLIWLSPARHQIIHTLLNRWKSSKIY